VDALTKLHKIFFKQRTRDQTLRDTEIVAIDKLILSTLYFSYVDLRPSAKRLCIAFSNVCSFFVCSSRR